MRLPEGRIVYRNLNGEPSVGWNYYGSTGLFSVVFRSSLTQVHLHAFMDRFTLFRPGYSQAAANLLCEVPAGIPQCQSAAVGEPPPRA
jgi:cystathionine beta-lyase/cystathionine gamma-synthase